MRILHSIPSINPASGGPVEAVAKLGLQYQRQGHEVAVLTLDDPAAPWLRDFPLQSHAVGPAFLRYGYTPRLIPWLRRNRSRFDLIIVNGLWQYSTFGVWRAIRGTSTPYFVFTHGMLDPWFKHAYPLKHVKKWLYWPWADYRVLRDAAAVLFTSEEERRLASQSFWLYRCNEQVINYGTAPPPEFDGAHLRAFYQSFPKAEGKRIVLFFGRIHEKKGCDLLVQAFASLVNRTPAGAVPWHLVLAGPVATEGYRRMLERLVSTTCPASSVTWTGLLTGESKWAAFRAADVFILPSHQENFGVAVVEALACGLPVLISNKVNIWREITEDDAGLVENDDAGGTVRLLERWAALGEAARERMRANARQSFAKRFHVRDTVERLTTTLEAYL